MKTFIIGALVVLSGCVGYTLTYTNEKGDYTQFHCKGDTHIRQNTTTGQLLYDCN